MKSIFGRNGLRAAALVSPLALALGAPAEALTINPIFDSSITSLSNAATVEAAFNQVAAIYDHAFSDPVTVNIGVSWGKVASYSLPSNAVGASVDALYGYFSYTAVRSLLQSDRVSANDYSAVANLASTAPSGTSLYVIPSAEAKALRWLSGTNTAIDGYVGFAGSSTSSFWYTGSTGATAGKYDFQGVAAHEIAEVLGRITGIGSSPAYRTPLDLFRYSAKGQLSYSNSAAAYLSINGGTTDLGNYNNSSLGGDRSDWLTLSTSQDVQDAFVSTGQYLNLSDADLAALDVIGWDWGESRGGVAVNGSNEQFFAAHLISDPSAVAEPTSLGLLACGVISASLLRRRKSV